MTAIFIPDGCRGSVARMAKAAASTNPAKLVGFIRHSSHLSLASELSADASFYLIGDRFVFVKIQRG